MTTQHNNTRQGKTTRHNTTQHKARQIEEQAAERTQTHKNYKMSKTKSKAQQQSEHDRRAGDADTHTVLHAQMDRHIHQSKDPLILLHLNLCECQTVYAHVCLIVYIKHANIRRHWPNLLSALKKNPHKVYSSLP
jgi:hypothetical protein